jgi:hypothetical protein
MSPRRRYDWRSTLRHFDGRRAWDELPPKQRLRTSIFAVAFCAAMVAGFWTGWVDAQGRGGPLWITLGALGVAAGFVHYGLQAVREIKKR